MTDEPFVIEWHGTPDDNVFLLESPGSPFYPQVVKVDQSFWATDSVADEVGPDDEPE